jgi:hypothetical protein
MDNSVYNNRHLSEGFQISHSDNKDLTEPGKSFPVRWGKKSQDYNSTVRQNIDLSLISATNPDYNFGGLGNNSKTTMYDEKKDLNYERMVADLFGNYTDPNIEMNESCAPPSLCKIQAVKNKFTCGCGNNVGKCFDTLSRKITGKIDAKENKEVVEGFANKYDSLNGVFYTDYGGGEKYIPCGECQDGFIKNVFGQCEKRCTNCKTYTTDQTNMLQKIDNDRENRFRGCGDCSSCGECQDCDNQCKCKNRMENMCDNCMRCKYCNSCRTRRKNSYFNMSELGGDYLKL